MTWKEKLQTLTSKWHPERNELSEVAMTGDYDDLINKPEGTSQGSSFDEGAVYLVPNWTKKITIEINDSDERIKEYYFKKQMGDYNIDYIFVENPICIYQKNLMSADISSNTYNFLYRFQQGTSKDSDLDSASFKIYIDLLTSLKDGLNNSLSDEPGGYIYTDGGIDSLYNLDGNSAEGEIFVYDKNRNLLSTHYNDDIGSAIIPNIEDYDEIIISITKNEPQVTTQ